MYSGTVRSALFKTGAIGCERLVSNPQLCAQVCEAIQTIAATTAPVDDSEAVQMLAAPELIVTLVGLLESGQGAAVGAAAGAVAALARHDSVRAALFGARAIANIQGLLLVKPMVATPTVTIVRAVLSEIVDAAVLRAADSDQDREGAHRVATIVCTNTRGTGAVSAALCHAATAVISAETAPERRAATTGWFSSRPRSGHAGRRGRMNVGEAEVSHRLEVLDSMARSFEQGQQPRRRYSARAVAARQVRRRERNWGGDRVAVARQSTQASGGAVERDKNLRLERAQRSDLDLYRGLTAAAEQRVKEVDMRVAQTRAKAKYGLGMPAVDARSVLRQHEPSWRTFAPGRPGPSANPDAGLLPARVRSS